MIGRQSGHDLREKANSATMSWSPASGRKELEEELRRVGGQADAQIDLAGAALILAALDRPRVSLDRYRHHLSLLTRDTAELGGKLGAEGSLEQRAEALKQVILGRYEYRGDQQTYDNLQNANLMRVIDRRKGLPVALGILFLHSARAQGWQMAGLRFPGHFLLRLEQGSERVILDPFNDANQLETADLRRMLKAMAGQEAELRPEYSAAASNREILLRLQNNIKVRLIEDQRAEEALEIVESMLMMAPGESTLWREAGVLHAHLENLRAAILSLENFLNLSQDETARHEVARTLQQIKSQVN